MVVIQGVVKKSVEKWREIIRNNQRFVENVCYLDMESVIVVVFSCVNNNLPEYNGTTFEKASVTKQK